MYNTQELIEQAQKILKANRRKGYTIPSSRIYPFQWNWDSAFVAIGLAHYDTDAAIEEMETLFKSQWNNGFLPHIVFWDESKEYLYFPNTSYYQSSRSVNTENSIGTSGFTQPPIHGMAIEYMLKNSPEPEKVIAFIKRIFPKIVHYHECLYKNRNLNGEGLIHIIHNWESGTDNLPVWDEIFKRMAPDLPVYDLENMRKDITHIDRKERPKNYEYSCYIHMLDICREANYDDRLIAEKTPFMVQDPMFNALLIRSNESLISLAEIAGRQDKIEQLKNWNEQTTAALNARLWDEELGCYVYYDCRTGKTIRERTASGMVPIIAGIVDENKLDKITHLIKSEYFGGDSDAYYCCPSFDIKSDKFESQRYWRGPVWINMNWLLMQGFKRYGNFEMYNLLENNILELITQFGFSEYYEPEKAKALEQKEAYGGSEFSWSAALLIDVLKPVSVLNE